jgi:hypothetical protein
VISPERPTTSHACSTAVSRIVSAGDHDAEVDHVVAVAAEHDPDDVLADVVHVALHGGEHHTSSGAAADLLPPP